MLWYGPALSRKNGTMCWGSYSNPQKLGNTPWGPLPYPLDFVVECQDVVVKEEERSSSVDMPCQGSVMVPSTKRPWMIGESPHAWNTVSTRKVPIDEGLEEARGNQGNSP